MRDLDMWDEPRYLAPKPQYTRNWLEIERDDFREASGFNLAREQERRVMEIERKEMEEDARDLYGKGEENEE